MTRAEAAIALAESQLECYREEQYRDEPYTPEELAYLDATVREQLADEQSQPVNVDGCNDPVFYGCRAMQLMRAAVPETKKVDNRAVVRKGSMEDFCWRWLAAMELATVGASTDVDTDVTYHVTAAGKAALQVLRRSKK